MWTVFLDSNRRRQVRPAGEALPGTVWLPLVLALALVGPPATMAGPDRPNVVMLFVDTLRADHIHCYGYDRRTSDSLDALAAGGTLFENAIAQSSWSLPSYAATFTSLYSSAHHVDERNQKLPPSLTTLATLLSANGYDTAAFVGGGHLSATFGLGTGFALYSDQPHFGSFFHTVPAAVRWLSEHRERPFFLMVHGYDAHIPYQVPLGFGEMYDPGYRGMIHDFDVLRYENVNRIANGVFSYPVSSVQGGPPPAGAGAGGSMEPIVPASATIASVTLGPTDRRHLIAHYDGAITYADTWLGIFLEQLHALGLAGNTVILVTGDHGEALGEHGYYRHRWELDESQIHVPLVLAGPGIAAGRRIPDVVELIDVAPTVLSLCGISPFHDHQGRSLKDYLDRSRPPPRDTARVAISTLSNCISARSEQWHLLRWTGGPRRGSVALFDLTTDPAEQHNLADLQPAVVDRLNGTLQDWREQTFRPAPVTGNVTATPEEQEMFRQGGYW